MPAADLALDPLDLGGRRRGRRDTGYDLPQDPVTVHGSVLDSDRFRGGVGTVLHHRPVPEPEVVDDLLSQCEDRLLVQDLVLVDMDRRNGKGIVSVGEDLFGGDVFIVFLDMDKKHMEMEQLFLLHTITFSAFKFHS
jgi:hypothetical protein